MKVNLKDKDNIEFTKDSPDDKIELIHSVTKVQSKINDVISADFVLSKLPDKEKEYVIEMSNNAFLSKRILEQIEAKSIIWDWNNDKKIWVWRKLNDEEQEKMKILKQKCFDAYMNRIYMINILNRNVPQNYIIQKITGIKDEEEDEETRLQNITKNVKERLGVKEE